MEMSHEHEKIYGFQGEMSENEDVDKLISSNMQNQF